MKNITVILPVHKINDDYYDDVDDVFAANVFSAGFGQLPKSNVDKNGDDIVGDDNYKAPPDEEWLQTSSEDDEIIESYIGDNNPNNFDAS